MNKQKILETLETKVYDKEAASFGFLEYMKLVEILQHDVLNENVPDNTTKKQHTACVRFLNQKWLERRPILQHTHLEENYQVFTDSYMLFRFFDNNINHNLPKTSDNVDLGPYPKTNTFKEGIIMYSENVLDLRKLLKITNTETIDLDLSNGKKVRVDTKKLKDYLNIMGYKNNEVLSFIINDFTQDYCIRPIVSQRNVNNSKIQGLLLPCRVI